MILPYFHTFRGYFDQLFFDPPPQDSTLIKDYKTICPSNINKTDENGLYHPSLMVKNFQKEFQQRNLSTSHHSYGTNSLQEILNSFLIKKQPQN